MDHISVVIVHYNTPQETRECLETLVQIVPDEFKYSVVVVDNGSKKPLHLPKTLLQDHVEVVRSESNLGFTGGNNLGITYAIEKYNSEYVLLLNSDTLVVPDFLGHLRKTLLQNSPGGLACPKIYFAKGYEYHKKSYQRSQLGSVIWYAGGSLDWPNIAAFHRGVDEVDRGHFDRQTSSDFATGCCILISRQVLETIGMFDDRYFVYSEDVDLSLRARERGFRILFSPQSVIWHKNAGSSDGAGSRFQQYYQTRNTIFFALKHGTLKARFTILRHAWSLLIGSNEVKRKAAFHALTGKLGKEPVI